MLGLSNKDEAGCQMTLDSQHQLRLPHSGLFSGKKKKDSCVFRPLFLHPWLLAAKCGFRLIEHETIILCIRQYKFQNCRL